MPPGFVDAIPHCGNALWWLRSRLFQAAHVNSLGFLCQNLLRFLGYKYVYGVTEFASISRPWYLGLKYAKEHF